jgi:hypothetical protein
MNYEGSQAMDPEKSRMASWGRPVETAVAPGRLGPAGWGGKSKFYPSLAGHLPPLRLGHGSQSPHFLEQRASGDVKRSRCASSAPFYSLHSAQPVTRASHNPAKPASLGRADTTSSPAFEPPSHA